MQTACHAAARCLRAFVLISTSSNCCAVFTKYYPGNVLLFVKTRHSLYKIPAKRVFRIHEVFRIPVVLSFYQRSIPNGFASVLVPKVTFAERQGAISVYQSSKLEIYDEYRQPRLSNYQNGYNYLLYPIRNRATAQR